MKSEIKGWASSLNRDDPEATKWVLNVEGKMVDAKKGRKKSWMPISMPDCQQAEQESSVKASISDG